MPPTNARTTEILSRPERRICLAARIAASILCACVAVPFYADAAPPAARLSRSVDVTGSPDEVWSLVGPFCAIKDWHPAIGACSEDGKTPPTRTLVTKDKSATFIELETARNDASHQYSYTFTSAPVPVTRYTATIKVAEKSAGVSTVTWSGVYTPNPGKEKDARDALTGIYEAGLAQIKATFAK